MKYWLGDLKKTERAVYLGHINSENRIYGMDEVLVDRLTQLCDKSEGIRIRTLRDLGDEYPTPMGSYYGADVFLVVKNGFLRKNQSTINEMRDMFN